MRTEGNEQSPVREFIKKMVSPEFIASVRMAGEGLYGIGRVGLGIVLHPLASFRAGLLIGDPASIDRDVQTSLTLPSLRGRQRFNP